jgi:hypothetical protein
MFSRDGGLVMGADCEETGEILKRSVEKLPIYRVNRDGGGNGSGNALIIGGAGPACHVETLTQLFQEIFADTTDTLELEARFREELEHYYKDHVLCWPSAMEREDNDFSLLIGTCVPAAEPPFNPNCKLWITEQNTLRTAFPYAAIGLGRTYANALLAEYHPGCTSATQATLAAIYILQKIKRNVSNCGEGTQLWHTWDGKMHPVAGRTISRSEDLFSQYEQLTGGQFFSIVQSEYNVLDENLLLRLKEIRFEFTKVVEEEDFFANRRRL